MELPKIFDKFCLSFDLDQDVMEPYKLGNGIDLKNEVNASLYFGKDNEKNKELFNEMVKTYSQIETMYNIVHSTNKRIFTGKVTTFIEFTEEFKVDDHIIIITDPSSQRVILAHSDNTDNDLLEDLKDIRDGKFIFKPDADRSFLYNYVNKEDENIGVLDLYNINITNKQNSLIVMLIAKSEKHALRSLMNGNADGKKFVNFPFILHLPIVDILDYRFTSGFEMDHYDASKIVVAY